MQLVVAILTSLFIYISMLVIDHYRKDEKEKYRMTIKKGPDRVEKFDIALFDLEKNDKIKIEKVDKERFTIDFREK